MKVWVVKLLFYTALEIILLGCQWGILMLNLQFQEQAPGGWQALVLTLTLAVLLVVAYRIGVRTAPLWQRAIVWTNTHPSGNHPQG
jgi:hypothetical protein